MEQLRDIVDVRSRDLLLGITTPCLVSSRNVEPRVAQ